MTRRRQTVRRQMSDCRLPVSSSRAQPSIFVIRVQADDVWKAQSGNLRASPYLCFAALPYFYAPHHSPLNPLNLLNLLPLFRTQSKDGTPHGLTLKFESRDE